MKRRIRYRVVKRGVTVSQHYTKKAALVSVRKHRGARLVRVGAYRSSYRKY